MLESIGDLRRARQITLLGVAASALLASLNIVAGMLSRSTSVTAAGAEFAGDVLASSIVLLGLTIAGRPADENHPYGHGRIEMLAAFCVGLILVFAGAGICVKSLEGIGEAHAPPAGVAVVAPAFAIVVRGIMSAAKFREGRRIRSTSLVADAWNDAVDIVAASTAVTAVTLTIYNPVRFLAADHYGGAVVGVIVVLTGLRVIRDASLELLDTMPRAEMVDEIRRTATGVPGVDAVEKVFARKSGLRYHIDLHVEVDPELTVAASHAIAGAVRQRLRVEVPWVADAIVHIEPTEGHPNR